MTAARHDASRPSAALKDRFPSISVTESEGDVWELEIQKSQSRMAEFFMSTSHRCKFGLAQRRLFDPGTKSESKNLALAGETRCNYRFSRLWCWWQERESKGPLFPLSLS